jgi:hypothetical protein
MGKSGLIRAGLRLALNVLSIGGMKEQAIDRSIPMVIFMTIVILAGLVTAGRDEQAAARVRLWFAGTGVSAAVSGK